MSKFDTVIDLALVMFLGLVLVVSGLVMASMPSQAEIRDVVISIQNGKSVGVVNSSKVAVNSVR